MKVGLLFMGYKCDHFIKFDLNIGIFHLLWGKKLQIFGRTIKNHTEILFRYNMTI